MPVKRGRHSPEFKFRVALEATKEQRTVSQLSSEFSLHPNQLAIGGSNFWKRGEPYSSPMGIVRYRVLRNRSYMSRSVALGWNWSGSKRLLSPPEVGAGMLVAIHTYQVGSR